MNRFFIEKINPKDKFIILSDYAQLHHLRDVLRIKPLEQAVVFDNSGNEYIVRVLEIGARAVKLEIKERRPVKEPGLRITVACAIPKKVKMDDIMDKLTQLGVECIIPLQTERMIVRLDKQKKQERLARWQKIALSAVKQSQRSRLPLIKPVTGFKDVVLAAHNFDLKLIPTLEGRRKTLREVFRDSSKKIERVMVLIGPEGDFTPDEVVLAKEAGFLPVSLGPLVLRVDTAAVAVVSFIKLNDPALPVNGGK